MLFERNVVSKLKDRLDWHPSGVYFGHKTPVYKKGKKVSTLRKGGFELRLFKIMAALTRNSTDIASRRSDVPDGRYRVNLFIGSDMTTTFLNEYVGESFEGNYTNLYFATRNKTLYFNQNDPTAKFFAEWIKPNGEPKTFKDLLGAPERDESINGFLFFNLSKGPFKSLDLNVAATAIAATHPNYTTDIHYDSREIYIHPKKQTTGGGRKKW